jgi:hypothetical protein
LGAVTPNLILPRILYIVHFKTFLVIDFGANLFKLLGVQSCRSVVLNFFLGLLLFSVFLIILVPLTLQQSYFFKCKISEVGSIFNVIIFLVPLKTFLVLFLGPGVVFIKVGRMA